ncbi:TetR/AcrR family transcriptional regulator [Kineococcus sp. LSe6-4]|uniref:TetR/AcrR family transcriptional regulator n=1 Tax=Kineococcus halophytocola TaxID=3234027 RepID=A0ABV4H2P6_9ACTN
MPPTERPLRRDAERNRRRLVECATDLMSRNGLGVSYEEVAREAGMGIGTVYRRFPDRQDLFDAVFGEHIDAVCALADDAAADEDPWRGLVGFFERQLQLEEATPALGMAMRGDAGSAAVVRRAHEHVTPVVRGLLARAADAGQVPAGLTPADLVAVHRMVGSVLDASREHAPDLWRRALAIALAGLRHADLPGPAPTDDVVEVLFGHPPTTTTGGTP